MLKYKVAIDLHILYVLYQRYEKIAFAESLSGGMKT